MNALSVFRIAFCVVATVPAIVHGTSEKRRPPAVENELIVRLNPDRFVGRAASAPPRIVGLINAGNAPEGLGVGNPTQARLVITERAGGRMAEWIEHNPDTPSARLQRYIVLGYPENSNIDAIEKALESNPSVEHVGRNVLLQLHAIPNDKYVGTGAENATEAQWGIHALNLPAAWELTESHAYLGFADHGLQTLHPDLRATHDEFGSTIFDGGAFRAHLSRDSLNANCSVDEIDPGDTFFDSTPGHGTHVVGTAVATTDNELGVAGVCKGYCSALVAKILPRGGGFASDLASAAEGVDFLARRGVQSINMSFGVNGILFGGVWECDVAESDVELLCDAMALADLREVVMVAASGNNRVATHPNPDVDFPAQDPRTIAAGGLELVAPGVAPTLWINESCQRFPLQCGSWIGPGQDLVTPADSILATVYSGEDHEIEFNCGDSLFPIENGYGLCTGTSMSAAFVTGLSGLVTSLSSLLPKEDVRDVLTSTASIPGSKDFELGHGIPDAAAAAERALGKVSGTTLKNRLTPLFVFESSPPAGAFQAQTHVYTTVPQFGSALLLEDVRTFNTVGPVVTTYGAFPEFCTDSVLPDCCPINQTCCIGQGPECVPKPLVDASTRPRASILIFTNHVPPTPSSPPLAPLFRLRYESALSENCPSPPEDPLSIARDFAYATSISEVETYLNGTQNGVFKYRLDGTEGYVYEHGPRGCPRHSVALHRLYNASRHDTVLVPASEAGVMKSQGYLPPIDQNLPEIVGCAIANLDSDADGLIDGWERLIGSDVLSSDSDDDGVADGQELLVYDRSAIDPALRGYRDPCSNGCPIFSDGFETGDTSAW